MCARACVCVCVVAWVCARACVYNYARFVMFTIFASYNIIYI